MTTDTTKQSPFADRIKQAENDIELLKLAEEMRALAEKGKAIESKLDSLRREVKKEEYALRDTDDELRRHRKTMAVRLSKEIDALPPRDREEAGI